MKGRVGVLLVWQLASLLAPGQVTQDDVREALEGGHFARAAQALASVLRSENDRGPVLKWAEDEFRRRGASESWLGALDTVLREDPTAGDVLFARAHTRLDLKLLRRARADFEELQRQRYDSSPVQVGLMWSAIIGFEHARAADLAQGLEPTVARYQGHLAASLSRGRSRQVGALVAASAFTLGAGLLLRRRLGSSREASP